METLFIQLPIATFSSAIRFDIGLAGEGDTPVMISRRLDEHVSPNRTATDVVAVVPARRLSWHRVEIPLAIRRQGRRIEVYIRNALEDALLEEPGELHFALAPNWEKDKVAWVAVCNRSWLRGHLEGLANAGYVVSRLIPELYPTPEPRVLALGHNRLPMLWFTHQRDGVWGVPLDKETAATALLSLNSDGAVSSEKIFADAPGSRYLDTYQDKAVTLITNGEHIQWSRTSDWDLLQWSLQSSESNRLLTKAWRGVNRWWSDLRWKRFRQGLAVLLAVNLIGLNLWAAIVQAQLDRQNDGLLQLFKSSYPQVKVVIDPHRQMLAEARLTQTKIQSTRFSFSSAISALGELTPSEAGLAKEIQFKGAALTVKGLKQSPEEIALIRTKLAEKNFDFRVSEDSWTVRPLVRAE
jgi:general secretion pathway protein L